MKAYTMGITKDEFVTEMKRHQELDAFVRGEYTNYERGDEFRGCAVGCSINSIRRIKDIYEEANVHKLYETRLGIPEWLAHVEDKIFENCSDARVKAWPLEFSEAINEGADLDKIKIPFLIFILETTRIHSKDKNTLDAVDDVLVELKRDVLDIPKLIEARDASYADAAYYASDAAYSAAYSAASAATSYSEDALIKSFDKFADKLLELIKECK